MSGEEPITPALGMIMAGELSVALVLLLLGEGDHGITLTLSVTVTLSVTLSRAGSICGIQ